MAAWGAGPFENDVSNGYVSEFAQKICATLLISKPQRLSPSKFRSGIHGTYKHELAYYYDQLRAAAEMMLLLTKANAFSFAEGYFDVAIDRIEDATRDEQWFRLWAGMKKNTRANFPNGLSKKGQNYMDDLNQQIRNLCNYRAQAKE
jgi:hypothetical protein